MNHNKDNTKSKLQKLWFKGESIDSILKHIYGKQIGNQKYEGIVDQKSEKDFWDWVTEYEKVWNNMEQKEI